MGVVEDEGILEGVQNLATAAEVLAGMGVVDGVVKVILTDGLLRVAALREEDSGISR